MMDNMQIMAHKKVHISYIKYTSAIVSLGLIKTKERDCKVHSDLYWTTKLRRKTKNCDTQSVNGEV